MKFLRDNKHNILDYLLSLTNEIGFSRNKRKEEIIYMRDYIKKSSENRLTKIQYLNHSDDILQFCCLVLELSLALLKGLWVAVLQMLKLESIFIKDAEIGENDILKYALHVVCYFFWFFRIIGRVPGAAAAAARRIFGKDTEKKDEDLPLSKLWCSTPIGDSKHVSINRSSSIWTN